MIENKFTRQKFKINILFIISTLLLFLISDSVMALTTATISDIEGVYIRKGPGTNYGNVGVLSYGRTVTLVSTTKHSGTGCDGWYQINYNGSTDRYVCSELVKVNQVSSNSKYYTTSVWGYRVNENYATVRASGSFSANQLDTIYLGTNVEIVGESAPTYNCTSGWYKVSYYNGTRSGYVCKRLIEKYEDITATNEDYCNTLETLGFPRSYCPFLTKLHQDHPTWIFNPVDTEINFDTAVQQELGKNYIQSKVPAYISSNVPVESGTWYKTSSPVVAYYLDPRNYLNEKNIFAFEVLDYNSTTQTADVLKAMFGSSYLKEDIYVNAFLRAANDFKISPIHLASRVIQEGGSKDTYDGVSGTSTLTYNGKSLKGFYNYYNIGAYEDGITNSSVARGLAVAAGYVDSYLGTPWTTREDAIYYGARFISNGYVADGQNTAYFQKFNTSPTSSHPNFTHQYMTNIIAPASEALSTYSTYNDSKVNLLETAFTFNIPVYDNMPNEYTAHPYTGDTDNNLSNIKINDINLNGFDEDVLSYSTYIDYNATNVKISATTKSNKSTLTGTGDIKITNNETEVKLVVTSEVGVSKTYTITLIKEDPPTTEDNTEDTINIDDIINKIDIKVNNNYLTGLEEGTSVTSLVNMFKKQEANLIVEVKYKNTNNHILSTGDIITLKANNDEKIYTIVIKGDTNGDGKISGVDMLRVQKHILKYSTLEGAFKEACDTNYDGKISSVDMLRVQKHILKYIKLK